MLTFHCHVPSTKNTLDSLSLSSPYMGRVLDAVIVAAGLGTRMLPVSGFVAKEMLPLLVRTNLRRIWSRSYSRKMEESRNVLEICPLGRNWLPLFIMALWKHFGRRPVTSPSSSHPSIGWFAYFFCRSICIPRHSRAIERRRIVTLLLGKVVFQAFFGPEGKRCRLR